MTVLRENSEYVEAGVELAQILLENHCVHCDCQIKPSSALDVLECECNNPCEYSSVIRNIREMIRKPQ